MTSSLTTALEEMRRENDVLKTDNTQLRTNNDAMKDEIGQLKTEVDMMQAEIVQLKIENDDLRAHHVDTSRSLHPPPVPPKRKQLKQQLVLKKSTTPDDLFSGPVNIKWEEGAPAPVNRAYHTAVWLNGLVYVGGGYETGIKASYIINCYDPVNNSWSSPINTPYCFFAMTTFNHILLIAGGEDKSYKRTNQILTMDAGQLKNYIKMITARSHATATGHQGMLIITGGEDNKYKRLSSTELFDSSNGQWYMSNDLPQPHSWLQSVIVDNTLYLLGGNNKDGDYSPAVFTVPLETLSRHQLKWNTLQDTPWCASAPVSVCGTHLLIVGGVKKIGDKYTRNSDVCKLNKVSHSWEAIGHIPSARYASAAVSTVDNRVIVIGGQNDKGVYTNTVWIGSCDPQ